MATNIHISSPPLLLFKSSSRLLSPTPYPFLLHFTPSPILTPTCLTGGPSSTHSSSSLRTRNPNNLICRAAEYKFPDPIPEFAQQETEKFRDHMLTTLSKKKERYGDSIDEIVEICTEIFSTFLHSEYGGPGTLMVVPFIDMADTLNERGLPGGPQAARVAVKWAQKYVDNDWKEWTRNSNNK